MNKKKVLSWGIVLLIMLIIFGFSSQDGNLSSFTSSGLTKDIYLFFNLDKFFLFDPFHTLVRKSAHFIIYTILGFFMCRALYYTYSDKIYIDILLISIFLCFLYAGFDEIHQLFIDGRSGEIRDVLIDTIGGSVGSMIYYIYLKLGCVRHDL